VQNLGANGIIAVNNSAGGHLGKLSAKEMMNEFKDEINIPIISAGGVGTKNGLEEKINLGFSGVSIGSPFIACEEADISLEYKQACVDYGKNDIVISTKLSGSPCTVINTPYVKKVGTKQNWLEKVLSKNKSLKKWVKMITFLKGMKSFEKAAFSSNYNAVWCAGTSIEYTTKISPVKDIIKRLVF
jgi:nitronate monooxygenase